MAWSPQLDELELVLVGCNVMARKGVPFHVCLTDQHLLYARRKSFAVSDPIETVSVALCEVKSPRLGRVSPWAYWLMGGFLVAAFAIYLFGFYADRDRSFEPRSLMLAGAGVLCFLFGRNRWCLKFSARGRSHVIKQPPSSTDFVRDQMAASLREIFRLLEDPGARLLTARQKLAERDEADASG
jgi:hypothetical protein